MGGDASPHEGALRTLHAVSGTIAKEACHSLHSIAQRSAHLRLAAALRPHHLQRLAAAQRREDIQRLRSSIL